MEKEGKRGKFLPEVAQNLADQKQFFRKGEKCEFKFKEFLAAIGNRRAKSVLHAPPAFSYK